MCNKAVDTYPSAMQFVPDQYKAQGMSVKVIDPCHFFLSFLLFDSVPEKSKTQEMCDKVVSKDSFMLKYCLDRYKTQGMCDKAVDIFLPTLTFVPDWFVTKK